MYRLQLKCPLVHLHASVSKSRGRSETSALFWTWYQYLEKWNENPQTLHDSVKALTSSFCSQYSQPYYHHLPWDYQANLIISLSLFISVTTSSPGLPGQSSSLFGSTQSLSALTLPHICLISSFIFFYFSQ